MNIFEWWVQSTTDISKFTDLDAYICQTPLKSSHKLKIHFPHQKSIVLSQETSGVVSLSDEPNL